MSLVRPVGDDDHIIGNPGAPVVIIEYADIDSGYSKDFQATMQQLMTEYAAGGEVAWVYRHMPLIDQHPNARRHAEAAERAASIGSADSFWRFIDSAAALAPGSSRNSTLPTTPSWSRVSAYASRRSMNAWKRIRSPGASWPTSRTASTRAPRARPSRSYSSGAGRPSP